MVWGFKECSSGSDTAKPTPEFLVTPFFPHRTPRAVKCKYSLSVNYGEYIKLVPDVVELACAGQNGIYIEEAGGRSGPFCGNKRMPAFVSRDVKFDIHIIIDTPLRGARVKIGYKSTTNPKGPNVAKVRGAGAGLKGVRETPIAILKMAPDQGQGALQQQNSQNIQNDMINAQEERLAAVGLGPRAGDVRPGIGAKHPPARGGPARRPAYDPENTSNKRWESETYNPAPVNDYNSHAGYPSYPSYEEKEPAESNGVGVELVLPVLFLMILIGVLILVMHKRRQRMKADLKKLETATGGSMSKDTLHRDFIPIEQASSMVKSEPTIEQLNHVIEAGNNAASIENTANSVSTTKIVTTPSNQTAVTAPSNKIVTNTMPSEKLIPPTPANTLAAPKETVEHTDNGRGLGRSRKTTVTAPSNKIEKKTVSTDSAVSTKSKDSQATTAPSIRSEVKSDYPTRPNRAPAARPTRKKNPVDEEDRPSY